MKCSILSATCCALVGRCHWAACCGGLSVTRFHFSIPSCGQFRYDMIYDPLPQMGFIGTTGDLGMFAGSRRKLGRRACGQLVLNILEKIGGCSLFRPAKTFPISGTTFGSRIHQKKHNTRNSHLPKYILLDTSLLI